ncbi:hypothetical protein SEA_MAMAPEARL_45 [Arthrobacter phage MamaPearl]|uniref:Uncharacterized protein n=1 Tax=Arthrobacter phage MamaPearl TaxID=2743906 RepID=A0AAE7K5R3_9CAUD|nr:hypothetical protein KDJ03_gp45 [Arthrobacter phage MamaPearl]QDH48233.1 hypothetical protein SEA_ESTEBANJULIOR_45 [Arthrobacter phage EstebanJulior]QKY79115.1 hypothetical protein SEA_MAMAPEARL_45 [Arthrobacter phage MamaPearl]
MSNGMVRMEAYLGPNKPETLAAGEGPDGASVAVVRAFFGSDDCEWVGAYQTTEDALSAVREADSQPHAYGILCSTRKVH